MNCATCGKAKFFNLFTSAWVCAICTPDGERIERLVREHIELRQLEQELREELGESQQEIHRLREALDLAIGVAETGLHGATEWDYSDETMANCRADLEKAKYLGRKPKPFAHLRAECERKP